MVARAYRPVLLGVVIALVVTLPGPALVSHPLASAAAAADDSGNPEASVPSQPLPPPANDPNPEAALNVDTSPDPVSLDLVPEGEAVVEVAEPSPTDPVVGGDDSGPVGAAVATPRRLR
jgi:hypothetical protein